MKEIVQELTKLKVGDAPLGGNCKDMKEFRRLRARLIVAGHHLGWITRRQWQALPASKHLNQVVYAISTRTANDEYAVAIHLVNMSPKK